MPVQRITKRIVDAQSPGAHDQFIWDSEISGFGLKTTPGGKKTFIVQYRVRDLGRRGTTKRLTLGEYGILTPDEARQLAREALGSVAKSGDPAAMKKERKAAKKVSEFGDDFLAHVKDHRKPGTHKEYERLWKKHVLSAIGTQTVADVSPVQIRKLHTSMRKTPYLANRVVAMLGAFFTFAEKENIRPPHSNPAHAVEFYTETSRERFLTPAEFKRLGEALARAETKGLPPAPTMRRKPGKPEKRKHVPKSADKPIPAHPSAVAAIRLLALTGCRENEILSLRWDAVDLERGYLRLADTKTGKSVRPLGATAAALIDAQPRVEGNPFVLPGLKNGQHIKEIKRIWFAVRHAAGLDELRIHDLRHSYASVPAASGESLLVLRSLLGHARAATTEKYAHLGNDPVKRAADKASGDIAGWLTAIEAESRELDGRPLV